MPGSAAAPAADAAAAEPSKDESDILLQQVRKCIKDGELVDVPPCILSKVVQNAQSLYQSADYRRNVLCNGITDGVDRALVMQRSTHFKIAQPERKQLHKQIILKLVKEYLPLMPKPDKAFIFAGPPGVGKSVLIEQFKSDTPFKNVFLEELHRDFLEQYHVTAKTTIESNKEGEVKLAIKQSIFREILPEYKENMAYLQSKEIPPFSIVKIEAEAITSAVYELLWKLPLSFTLAYEINGTNQMSRFTIPEQLKQSELTAIGLICDTDEAIERAGAKGDVVKATLVKRAIDAFKQPRQFNSLRIPGFDAYHQDCVKSGLFISGKDGYHAIKRHKDGIVDVDPKLYEAFQNMDPYEGMDKGK